MPDPNVPSPEQIREFPDRGTLWLLEDPVMLRDLLRLVEPGLADHLDFPRAIRVNRSLVPADLQKQETDLIFRVPFREPAPAGPEVWMYVLLEHQSKPDPLMPLRLLESMVELWRIQTREWDDRGLPGPQRRLWPVVPLVFYTGRRRWRLPLRLADLMAAPAELGRFIPGWETLFLNLHRTSPAILTQFATAVGYALRVLQAEQAPREHLEQVLGEALAGLEGLTEEQRGQWVRVAWYLVLLVFHCREQSEYTELERLIEERARASKFRLKVEVAQMGKTMAQVVEERAEERGEKRGEARGEARGLRRALETVLESRFGPLSPEIKAALAAADLDTLDGWLRRAAQAESLADLGVLPVEPAP
jgi:hypothetical protein